MQTIIHSLYSPAILCMVEYHIYSKHVVEKHVSLYIYIYINHHVSNQLLYLARVQPCRYNKNQSGVTYASVTSCVFLLRVIWVSLGPRPKNNPSVDRFQYGAHYTGSNISEQSTILQNTYTQSRSQTSSGAYMIVFILGICNYARLLARPDVGLTFPRILN